MRLASYLSLSLCSLAAASQLSADILYWPVTSAQPTPLAKISYDASSPSSKVISYSPPNPAQSQNKKPSSEHDLPEDLVRIGLYISTPTNSKQWVGTLTSWSALLGSGSGSGEHTPTFRLNLSPEDKQVYQISVASAASSAASAEGNPKIELVTSDVGPSPHLNRPVVVNPDGTPEEVPEKTLFQKYWWVFLIITFLAMSGGGQEGQ